MAFRKHTLAFEDLVLNSVESNNQQLQSLVEALTGMEKAAQTGLWSDTESWPAS